MLQAEMKIIDGKEFTVIPFSFFTARNMELKLSKIALPVLAKTMGSFKGVTADNIESFSLMDANIDGATLSGAIEALYTHLSESQYMALILSFFANTRAAFDNDEGKKVDIELTNDINFTLVFGRSVTTMYKVIAFVAEVNFPDYFGKASVIGQKLNTMITSFVARSTQTK